MEFAYENNSGVRPRAVLQHWVCVVSKWEKGAGQLLGGCGLGPGSRVITLVNVGYSDTFLRTWMKAFAIPYEHDCTSKLPARRFHMIFSLLLTARFVEMPRP